jgi:PDZ domain-containing protein
VFSLLVDQADDRRDPGPRAGWPVYVGWIALVLAVVGAVILALSPSPYVVERPGPVFDTLGEVEMGDETVPLIDIPDETTYPTEGTLDLLTVVVDGSREIPLAWLDVASSWFDPRHAVVPVDAIFPDGQTQEEADEQSALAMQNSQQYAIAAALDELGVGYTSEVEIVETIDEFPADGVLLPGDVVLAIGDLPVSTVLELRAELARSGVGAPVTFTVRRDGAEIPIEVTPVASDTDGSPVVGVAARDEYEFPIDVRIQLERVGGPSAGMMFALGIYDKLTPGALTGGERVAGTGTIAPGGAVGPIGGIVQKMYGALDAGAEWFLAPASNCDEVVGHAPDGLRVVAVSDLDGAISALEAIGAGKSTELPTCER